MQPTLADVLTTLAHEIRTPLAVSQGYLKLYLDGLIASPDDQRRALQQAREAMGGIASLCADIDKVTALAAGPAPALAERMDVTMLARDLRAARELGDVTWQERIDGAGRVATNAPTDLVRALTVLITSAFGERKHGPHRIELDAAGGALVIRAGSAADLDQLPATSDAANAVAINLTRGGHGLAVIWAAWVLHHHRVLAWRASSAGATVGLQIPLAPL